MKRSLVVSAVVALVLAACLVFGLVACDNPTPQQNQSGYTLNFNTVYALAEEAGYTGSMEDLVALFKGDNAYELAKARPMPRCKRRSPSTRT